MRALLLFMLVQKNIKLFQLLNTKLGNHLIGTIKS